MCSDHWIIPFRFAYARTFARPFRVSPMVTLKYAAEVSRIDGLVVNCLDQLPSTVTVGIGYTDSSQIPIPRSLKDQSRLTSRLEQVDPLIRETSVDGLLESLAEIAPVMITSDGPSHLDRQAEWWLSNDATVGRSGVGSSRDQEFATIR